MAGTSACQAHARFFRDSAAGTLLFVQEDLQTFFIKFNIHQACLVLHHFWGSD